MNEAAKLIVQSIEEISDATKLWGRCDCDQVRKWLERSRALLPDELPVELRSTVIEAADALPVGTVRYDMLAAAKARGSNPELTGGICLEQNEWFRFREGYAREFVPALRKVAARIEALAMTENQSNENNGRTLENLQSRERAFARALHDLGAYGSGESKRLNEIRGQLTRNNAVLSDDDIRRAREALQKSGVVEISGRKWKLSTAGHAMFQPA